jgi:hypothetical protein
MSQGDWDPSSESDGSRDVLDRLSSSHGSTTIRTQVVRSFALVPTAFFTISEGCNSVFYLLHPIIEFNEHTATAR